MMQFYLFFVVLAFISFTSKINAQQQEAQQKYAQQFVHPLTNMPFPSEEIETSFHFPEHEDKKFPIGQVVTALCHFSNTGNSPFNITAIMGSLNSPFNFDFYIQNYSYKPVGIVVNPGEEVSLDYQFQLHPNLEPTEYVIAHTVFYENQQRNPFSSTFFNETVELYYPTSDFDLQTLGQLFGGIAFSIATIAITFFLCTIDQRSPTSAFATIGSKSKASKAASNDDDDWVSAHLDTAKPKKA
jgi:hypothetical protein